MCRGAQPERVPAAPIAPAFWIDTHDSATQPSTFPEPRGRAGTILRVVLRDRRRHLESVPGTKLSWLPVPAQSRTMKTARGQEGKCELCGGAWERSFHSTTRPVSERPKPGSTLNANK